MIWPLSKVLLYVLGFVVLTHGLYRILRRFHSVRRVVVSYHILVILLAVLIFLVLGRAEGIGPLERGQALVDTAYGKVIVGTVVCLAVLVLLRLADMVLVGHLLGERLEIPISVIVRHIAIAILLAVTILTVLSESGWEIGPLLATSAIGTAIIGLALQDVLGNVIAGVALQAEKPFKVGDWVEIGDVMGEVVEMNWRATKLATLDYDYMIIPNSMVARDRIRNFAAPTLSEARHLHVGVEYGQPPGKVRSVLMEAIQGAEGVLPTPVPEVWVVKYGDFAITYEIKFWLDRFREHPEIQDNVMTRIWYYFKRNGITIPFPIRNVFHYRLTQGFVQDVLQPGSPEVIGILRDVQLLQPLNEEELSALSNRLRAALFTAGETLVRQSEPGASFMIIVVPIRTALQANRRASSPLTGISVSTSSSSACRPYASKAAGK